VIYTVRGDLIVSASFEPLRSLGGMIYEDKLNRRHYTFATTRETALIDRRRLVLVLNRLFRQALGYQPSAVDGWWQIEPVKLGSRI
jgi:hypothetical protein